LAINLPAMGPSHYNLQHILEKGRWVVVGTFGFGSERCGIDAPFSLLKSLLEGRMSVIPAVAEHFGVIGISRFGNTDELETIRLDPGSICQ
jgi:hypothetical protein